MSILDIFSRKRESVHISAKSAVVLADDRRDQRVICYKCDREIDERHQVEGCAYKGSTRRVFFGRMAATVAGAAVVAKVAPELITAPSVKLPSNLSKESLLAHVSKQQEALNRAISQQAEAIVAVPEPIVIPSDIPSGLRSGTFFAQSNGFFIEYKAMHHMDFDRVSLTAKEEQVANETTDWAYGSWRYENISPPRSYWSGKKFEGGLHETITMVNREYPHMAMDLRQAIISCNPEYRWGLEHTEKPAWAEPAKETANVYPVNFPPPRGRRRRASFPAARLAAMKLDPRRLPA